MIKLLYYLVTNVSSNILIIVFALVGVAYLTILKRKVLRYIQYRKGPNKVGFLDLLQPFSDGLKLLNKESVVLLFKANYYIYYICPLILIVFMFLLL